MVPKRHDRSVLARSHGDRITAHAEGMGITATLPNEGYAAATNYGTQGVWGNERRLEAARG